MNTKVGRLAFVLQIDGRRRPARARAADRREEAAGSTSCCRSTGGGGGLELVLDGREYCWWPGPVGGGQLQVAGGRDLELELWRRCGRKKETGGNDWGVGLGR
jgi:hypothetical protein